MRVENNNVSGQNNDPEQIDLIDLLVQLWRGKMTIIISVIMAIAPLLDIWQLRRRNGRQQQLSLSPTWGKLLAITMP